MGKVTMQRIIVGFASILLASTPLAPAFAQAAPANAFAVGTVVTDAKGGAVGTVTAVNGDIVTVHTDKLDANLSKSSFTPSEGKLLVGLTQAELNAAVEKDKAAADASRAVGAEHRPWVDSGMRTWISDAAAERESLYASVADIVIDTGARPPEASAAELLDRLRDIPACRKALGSNELLK